jgi:hypothetical protein
LLVCYLKIYVYLTLKLILMVLTFLIMFDNINSVGSTLN